jgi:hypothetical protein
MATNREHDTFRYSYSEFVAAAKASPAHNFGNAWCGGLDLAETLNRAENGDESNVERANELLEQIDGAVETPHRMWAPAIGGAYPMVPDYLAGHPMSMRYLEQQVSDTTPISLYISIMASAGVDAETMQRRGIAALALVLKLQQIRPIELYAICPWIGTTLVINIPTRPLSIAHAAFCLSHPAFFRRLGHQVLYSLPADHSTTLNVDSRIPAILGMGEGDLLVGNGVQALDWNGKAGAAYADMLADPVGWVNQQVARYGERGDE